MQAIVFGILLLNNNLNNRRFQNRLLINSALDLLIAIHSHRVRIHLDGIHSLSLRNHNFKHNLLNKSSNRDKLNIAQVRQTPAVGITLLQCQNIVKLPLSLQ